MSDAKKGNRFRMKNSLFGAFRNGENPPHAWSPQIASATTDCGVSRSACMARARCTGNWKRINHPVLPALHGQKQRIPAFFSPTSLTPSMWVPFFMPNAGGNLRPQPTAPDCVGNPPTASRSSQITVPFASAETANPARPWGTMRPPHNPPRMLPPPAC